MKLIFSKPSFRAFLNATCEAADLVQVTKSVKGALEEWYQLLTACFAYFSGSTTGMGGDAIHSMGLNEWRGRRRPRPRRRARPSLPAHHHTGACGECVRVRRCTMCEQ